MELSEFFVEESLAQILEGITKAQAREGGTNVAAGNHGGTSNPQLFYSGNAGMFTVVDFDVSVIAETKGGGKAGIKVWGLADAGGSLESRGQNTSRVKFAVHLKLPQGSPAPPRPPLTGTFRT